MKKVLALLIAAVLLAPAYAQERGARGVQGQRDSFTPRERQDRDAFRRERSERRDERAHERTRERRFTREEHEKLRQDILDANRDMRRRR